MSPKLSNRSDGQCTVKVTDRHKSNWINNTSNFGCPRAIMLVMSVSMAIWVLLGGGGDEERGAEDLNDIAESKRREILF